MYRLVYFDKGGEPMWLQVFPYDTEDDVLWRHDLARAAKLRAPLQGLICQKCSRPFYICKNDPKTCLARSVKPKPRTPGDGR
jgi:hypothetical protein